MRYVMQRIIVVFLLIGCTPKPDNETTEDFKNNMMPSDTIRRMGSFIDITQDPDYQKGLVIVTMNDCANCHKINERLVGPSFSDVATRYSPASEPMIDTLAKKVIKGGSGHWGEAAMAPHSNLSLQDAKAAIKYVLLLRK